MLSRRSLFGGLAALVAAPAIVRVANIMQVSPQKIIIPAYEFAPVQYPWSNLDEIVTTTLRVRADDIAKSVIQHNALFTRLVQATA